MRYEERIIDEVQSLNDIVDIISGYLPLKRAGRTFKALCPFHDEKTPSFNVHPEKQIYHCFGCGVGGNVFSFLMKYENLTFPEALRQLAARVNYALPEPKRQSPEEVSESEVLYEIYRLAQEYYSANLKHPEKGRAAREYLKKRGFGEDILEEFPLGWATPEWRGLFEALSRKGVKDTALYRSGLILKGKEGHPYDLFRGRLLFPIHNLQGKVIAFGGRGLADEMPKYLNSSESAIFKKRRELFGLHASKRFISREQPNLLIVEGYFDFLMVYLSGHRNVAATLGTSLTEDHIRVLRRYVEEAVMVFDGDKAGEAAAVRGLEVFLEGEMSVRVALLPPGKDPDTFIREKGAEEFGKLIAEALDFFDFKWRVLSRRYPPSTSAGLIKISREFLESFSKIKNSILLDRYLKRLAGLLHVHEESLRNELTLLKKKITPAVKSDKPVSAQPPSSQDREEGTLITLLFEEEAFWEKAGERLSAEDFRLPWTRELFEFLRECYSGDKSSTYPQRLNRLQDESIKTLIVAHSLVDLAPQQKEKAFFDCLRKVEQRRTQERLEKLRLAIGRAEKTGENEKVAQLLHEYRSILAQKS